MSSCQNSKWQNVQLPNILGQKCPVAVYTMAKSSKTSGCQNSEGKNVQLPKFREQNVQLPNIRLPNIHDKNVLLSIFRGQMSMWPKTVTLQSAWVRGLGVTLSPLLLPPIPPYTAGGGGVERKTRI